MPPPYENVHTLRKKFEWTSQICVKTVFLSKIQNGRHEITEVIISSSIIEIETRLFHQIMFSVERQCSVILQC